MKLKCRLQSLRKIIVTICLFGISFSSVVFQSCEKENFTPGIGEYDEFLDVKNSTGGIISKKDFSVVKRARNRIEPYVSTKKGKYYLELSSGSEINISSRLFNLFKQQIAATNRLIENDNYILYNKKLIPKTKEIPFSGVKRLKTGSNESEADTSKQDSSDFDYEGTDAELRVSWYGWQVKLSAKVTQNLYDALTITGVVLPEPISKTVIGVAGVAGSSFYENYGNGKGVTIHCTPVGAITTFN